MPSNKRKAEKEEEEVEDDDDDEDEIWGQRIQSKQYWENRYKNERGETFEWYCTYEQVGPLLESTFCNKNIQKEDCHVLEIGCGNSEITLGLHDAGYNVIGSDYAEEQINFLKQQHPHVQFDHVDCRELLHMYGKQRFHSVVDKACLDSMLSGGSNGKKTAMKTCEQVDHVLKDGGSFVVISHADPETELGTVLLSEVVLGNVDTVNYRWDVDVHSVDVDEDEEVDTEDNDDVGVEGIHVYVFHKVKIYETRLQNKRKRDGSTNDGGFRIKRHFH
jgi:SAM-dependent methyltransferase